MPSIALRRSVLACAAAFATTLAAIDAASAAPTLEGPHPVRVHYGVDDGRGTTPCLSHDRIQAATNRALKRTVFVARVESDVAVVVRHEGEAGAEVKLFDAGGQPLGSRVLVAKDCAELSELVVFALTLMVDFRSDEVGRKREEAARAERDARAAEGRSEGNDDATTASADLPVPSSGEAQGSSGVNGSSAALRAPAADSRSHSGGTGARVRATAGGVVETGMTPRPLVGLYAQALFDTSAPLFIGARLRGQHLFETPRADGQLSAWRVAATGQACWLGGAVRGLTLGVCLGATPSATWVSVTGFDAERTTLFWGVGVEPTFEVAFALGPRVGARLGLGGAFPLMRTDWHARRPTGNQTDLFRAEAVGFLGFLGVDWGD